jgi:hypothetical protein
MKKTLIVLVAVALASCGSNDKSSKKSESTAAKSDSSVAAKPAETKPTTAWGYKTDTDKMTSKQRFFAEVVATNTLHFEAPYEGGSTATVVIRNIDKKSEVVLTIDKGQFLGGDEHPINVRFDSDAPMQFRADEPSDGSSTVLFIAPPAKFISRIKTAKKMIVQAEFYESGAQTMEFNVADLKWEH